MIITSSVIYYMISRKHLINTKIRKSTNISLKSPRILRDTAPEAGYLYLVELKEENTEIYDCAGSAFLFCGSPGLLSKEKGVQSDFAVMEEVHEIHELLDEVFEIFQELQQWDCVLKDARNQEIALADFFLLGEKVIEKPYIMIDRNLAVAAYSSDYVDYLKSAMEKDAFDILRLPPVKANELLMDEEYHISIRRKIPYVYPSYSCEERHLCINIFNGERYLARMSLLLPCADYEPDPGEVRLFEHFGTYVRDIHLKYMDDVRVRHQNDSLHNLFRMLLFHPQEVNFKKVEKILGSYDWKNNQEYSLVKLRFIEGDRWENSANYMCGQLERELLQSCAIRHENSIFWLVNHGNGGTKEQLDVFLQSLVYLIRENICKAGISNTFHDFLHLRTYCRQAESALEIGQKKNTYLWCYKFGNYVYEYILEQMTAEFSGEQLCHKGLLVLKEHDEKYNTEYVETLKEYILSRFNITQAAQKLFIHRTTFIRRMEKILEISGINIESQDEILHLMLSFKMQ